MTTLTRPGPMTAHSRQSELLSMITLALWRLRHSVFMLFMTGLGTVCAVMIVCALPVLQVVTTTAALRDLLRATPSNSELMVQVSSRTLASARYAQQSQQLGQPFMQQMSPYLTSAPPQATLQVLNLPVISPHPISHVATFTLTGVNVPETSSHLKILQGRLPQENMSGPLEIALSQETARELTNEPLHIGTLFSTTLSSRLDSSSDPTKYTPRPLQFRLVGIFQTLENDPYWHGDTLDPTAEGDPPKNIHYPLLLSLPALLKQADRLATHEVPGSQLVLEKPFSLYWYRHFDISKISVLQFPDLEQRLQLLQAIYANKFGSNANNQALDISNIFLSGAAISYYNQPGILERLQNRLSVSNIPIFLISGAIAALVLYFVAIMISLLVEHQANTITMLRSRGASGRQVFLTLATQCLILALLALLLGPLLALALVAFFVPRLLPTSTLDALNVLWPNPLPVLALTPAYALGAIFISLVIMFFALQQALRSNILDQRRQAARASQAPLWQRFYLDVILLVVALVAYILVLYTSSFPGLLDIGTYLLVISPLRILVPIFLVIALMLLFLRLFPLLLKLVARLAQRGKSAAPMLAFAQMTRSPQRALQMILLLSLACAFAFMSLVFATTQDTHLTDVTNYQTMSDFSAQISDLAEEPLRDTYARYRSLPGVTSLSIGYVNDGTLTGETPGRLFAIDSQTFAQTTLWQSSNSSKSLSVLMHELAEKSANANFKDGIPAIVDASTLNNLNLHVGSTFSINGASLGDQTLHLVIIDSVDHIQSLNNSTDAAFNLSNPLPSGVLIDYETMNRYQVQDGGQITTPNMIWMRSQDSSPALKALRNALSDPMLSLVNIEDRRAMINSLHQDPQTLELLGLILIGTVTAFVLALFGNFVAAWQSARSRLAHFAVLRALGTDARQVAQVLFWEQCTIYGTALVLGIFFAVVLALLVVPNLVFTTTPVSGENTYLGGAEFYALQYIVPTHIIYPSSLWLALGLFIAICVLAILMMIRLVLRPTLSRMLRLNED
ncbi:hypothetical protein KSC_054870 [Ktedonobacter sp. SOSP1-52]|uniref:FtsX-like permease family protein n=1 Tax=Ktedonobacter sp. SOSP1-52 TaxID=2778366 RepID=UPI0019151864|nr:FtsX-like permease family protein [Ktedonobacter sp. SOSP1-52]GHO66595.1 hypothetical protein KSC_054870 [Ktedonobacter sp. SOSP1-52]